MPTLSDKLKSLGVKVGPADLPTPLPVQPASLDQVLGGAAYLTPQGETYRVEARYPADHPHGSAHLHIHAPLHGLALWGRDNHIAELPPQSFAFLDTETTGLSGGSGTYAFLIGIGRFEGEEFHLAQFFMRDPLEEPAQLAAFEEFLAPCQAMVTFNGKTFDIPLLYTRFVTHGWQPPFTGLAHLDLLHLARRLWRDRISNRSLSNLEWQILGALRTEEDVPGWEIPELYFDYLKDGDPSPLKRVFYHNAMDVVSLAALMNHMAALLANPLQAELEHGVDLIDLAKLFEDLGDLDTATRLYIHGLEHEDAHAELLPKALFLDAIQRLAQIHKRQQDFPAAIELWQQAARHRHLEAHLELAKFYEHHQKDYPEAIYWTQTAIALVEDPQALADLPRLLTPYERRQWLAELTHRLERLQNKQHGHEPGSNQGPQA